ncbi:MAG TPA: TylF/MycF/NovP-related O-methyltransferase [Aeromicrobium sp.]|nr:TylF/MycF/NovP-related O-methyltransferase [Aeromicrobium sp.]
MSDSQPPKRVVRVARNLCRKILGSDSSDRKVEAGQATPHESKARDELLEKLSETQSALKQTQAELSATRRQFFQTRADLRAALFELHVQDASLSDSVTDVIAGVREDKLTFLSEACLRDLAAFVRILDEDHVEGMILEAGAALGGSSIVMAAAKSQNRPMKVYDVFGLIPPPTSRDGEDVHERYAKIAAGGAEGHDGEIYYGYRDDLYSEVTESFTRHGVRVDENNVELIKGLFEDTVHIDEPVALAHLDGDWYESTKVCLERIAPHLVDRGRMVIDDYDAWSGCRTAVDEFIAGNPDFELLRRAKVQIVRKD